MPNLIVRAATEGDIPEVLHLWEIAGSPPSVSDTHDGLSQLLTNCPDGLLLAVHEAVLIGSLIAVFDGWRASFYRLAVHPDHRRRGVASRLLADGERRVAQQGALRLTAIAVDSDSRASGFWKAAGYVAQQDRARFVKPTETP